MVICLERGLERGADLHMAQLMPLPLTVSCFSKIHIGFTFFVPAHPGSPERRAVKRARVCVSDDGTILQVNNSYKRRKFGTVRCSVQNLGDVIVSNEAAEIPARHAEMSAHVREL